MPRAIHEEQKKGPKTLACKTLCFRHIRKIFNAVAEEQQYSLPAPQ